MENRLQLLLVGVVLSAWSLVAAAAVPLDDHVAAVRAATSFRVTIAVVNTVEDPDETADPAPPLISRYVVTVETSGAIHVAIDSGGNTGWLLSMPDHSLVVSDSAGCYSRRSRGGSWSDRLATLQDTGIDPQTWQLVAALLDAEQMTRLLPAKTELAPIQTNAEETTYQANLTHDAIFQVTTRAEAKGLPTGLRVSIPRTGKDRVDRVQITFSDWDLTATISDKQRDMRPPAGLIYVLRPDLVADRFDPHAAARRAREIAEYAAIPRQPLPQGEARRTWATTATRTKAVTQRLYLAEYKANGRRDEAWDADAEAFLGGLSVAWADREFDPHVERLMAMAARLEAAKCTDPMVLSLIADLYYRQKQFRPADLLLETAWQPDQIAKYRPAVQYAICRSKAMTQYRGSKFATYSDQMMSALAATIADPDNTPDDVQWIIEEFEKDMREGRRPLTAAILAAIHPDLPGDPALLNYVIGRAHLQAVLWGEQKQDTSYETVDEHLAAAKRHLLLAWKSRTDVPEIPFTLLTLDFHYEGSATAVRQWFDATVHANIDFGVVYSTHSKMCCPHRYGSKPALYAFARELMAYPDPEGFTRAMIFRGPLHTLMDDVAPIAGVQDVLTEPGFYDEIAATIRELIAAENSYMSKADWHGALAAMAWHAGRYAESRAALEACDWTFDEAAISAQFHLNVADMKRDARAFTAPGGDGLQMVRELANIRQFQAAADALAAIVAAHPEEAELQAWARDFGAAIDAGRRFEAGESVDLMAADGLNGWEVYTGEWGRGEDGELIALDPEGVRNQDTLMHRADFGSRYEVDLEFLPALRTGIGVHLMATPGGRYDVRSPPLGVVLQQSPRDAQYFYNTRPDDGPKFSAAAQVYRRPSMRIQVWDGTANLYVGGDLVATDIHLWHDRYMTPARIAIFDCVGTNEAQGVSAMTIRKLTEKPTFTRRDIRLTEQLAIFEKAVATFDHKTATSYARRLQRAEFEGGELQRYTTAMRRFTVMDTFMKGEVVDLLTALPDIDDWDTQFALSSKTDYFEIVDGTIVLHHDRGKPEVRLPIPPGNFQIDIRVKDMTPSRIVIGDFEQETGDDQVWAFSLMKSTKFKGIRASVEFNPWNRVAFTLPGPEIVARMTYRDGTLTIATPDGKESQSREISPRTGGMVLQFERPFQAFKDTGTAVIDQLTVRKLPDKNDEE